MRKKEYNRTKVQIVLGCSCFPQFANDAALTIIQGRKNSHECFRRTLLFVIGVSHSDGLYCCILKYIPYVKIDNKNNKK